MENEIRDYLLSIENEDELIEKINSIKKTMHEVSPFKNEPVDCVIWVKNDTRANESALKYLNKWLVNNGLEEVDMRTGILDGRQVEIY